MQKINRVNEIISIYLIFLFLISATVLFDTTSSNIQWKNRNFSSNPTGTKSTTLIVDKNGDGDYVTIQEAIDSAASGDTIHVYSGTYYEHIYLNKTLNLKGNGTTETIINGTTKGDGITINSPWCNITGFSINSFNEVNDVGIRALHNYSKIVNCNTSDNYYGIFLDGSSFSIINNSTSNFNNWNGIQITESLYVNVINCESNSNKQCGLEMESLLEHNNILNCSFNYNKYGMHIGGGYNKISGCIVHSNLAGIWDTGGYTEYSNNSIIQNNFKGIHVADVGCSIFHNLIKNNGDFGVYLGLSSSYNKVFYNNFINNNNGGVQGEDYGYKNKWNLIMKGNYWSDWTAPDDDNNGFVDVPYLINGSANSKDNYPLTNPSGTPKITTIDNTIAKEEEQYLVEYNAFDTNTSFEMLTWTILSNASWVNTSFDNQLKGTPSNWDVGLYWVNVSVSDGMNSDYTNFTINVSDVNDAPQITTDDIETCNEDELYYVDYNASDIDLTNDILLWTLETDASFLSINSSTGVLSGIAENEDYGIYWVNVQVSDQRGGVDSHNFTLFTTDINDPPKILTTDTVNCLEDELYYNQYEAIDSDPGNDTLFWEVKTNNIFLEIDFSSGNLSGKPLNDDVGVFWVNVSVSDGKGGLDSNNFTLEVINTNDPPVITTKDDTYCLEDFLYNVDYNATDVDPTIDILSWSIQTNASFLKINSTSGKLLGTPSNEDVGNYWVNISVSDGNEGVDYSNFTLKVNNTRDSPILGDVISELSIYEDTNNTDINLYDWFKDPDGFPIGFCCRGKKHLNVEFYENGKIKLLPESNWNGYEVLTFEAANSIGNISNEINITVFPVNDRPISVSILGIDNNTSVMSGMKLNLTGVVEDVDLEYEGDSFSYLWTSNISSELGTDESLTNLILSSGHHQITVTVIDKGGESVQTSIIVIVEEENEPGDDDDEDVNEDDNTLGTFLALILILVPLLIIILIFGYFLIKSRMGKIQDKEEIDIEDSDEDEIEIEEE